MRLEIGLRIIDVTEMVSSLNQIARRRKRKAWWRMVVKPASTMEAILAVAKGKGGLGIGALMGIAQVANIPLLYPGDGNSSGEVFSWILVVGPVAGWALLWLGGWVVWKLGLVLFSGQGNAHAIRLALGWGAIPMIWSLVIWFPLILFFWGEGFLEVVHTLRFLFGGVTVWTLISVSIAVGVAHRISVWKAVACLVLTFSLLSLPLSFLVGPPG